MRDALRIWHNPRCSKSRATLRLLEQRGLEPEIIHYLDTPPDAAALAHAAALLGIPARALLRTGEPDYAALGLADPALGDTVLLQAMAAHPRLIERPIVFHRGRAALGRPPEAVLAIL